MNGSTTTGAVTGPVAADALRTLFRPASIALVGATDKSGWSLSAFNNLRNSGFAGTIYLVNPHTEVVHGEPAYRSLSDIGEPVDLAYVMVPTAAVLPVLREGASRGIRSYVVLTAGFAETGDEGKRLEDEIVAFAARHDLTVLGPNGNGYINAAARITPYGLPIAAPLVAGSVGVVLQSGALASSVLAFAQARNVGLSLLTSMGNEAMVSVTDVLSYLVHDPDTRVIALFLETVRHPERFARACRDAARAGKPVVVMKIGRSALASHTARAHTGALVGDDRVIEAAFRQLGVIRVHCLEDLIITSGLLAGIGRVGGSRIGVVTPSGGACEIIADRAEQEGLQLPEFAPETVARLKELLPGFATVANPLDVTGYVVVDRTLLGRALEVVARDPGIDAAMLLTDLPRVAPADPAHAIVLARATAQRIRSAPVPVMVVGNVLSDITEFGRHVQSAVNFPYVAGGIEHGMTAIGNAVRWSERVERAVRAATHVQPRAPAEAAGEPGEVWSEHRAARLLGQHGIPVVPSELVTGEAEAVAAAERFGYPVVLKAAAGGLSHKSDIGGVRLGLTGQAAVRAAHREMTTALRERGITEAAALIQPQRHGGIELLVGIVRDPAWGLTMVLGLGGIWVEMLADTAVRLLPVDAAGIREALGELRGAGLLTGARGTQPADLDRLCRVIARIGDLAQRLGPRLATLEVNPLLVSGTGVEVLDALITWSGT